MTDTYRALCEELVDDLEMSDWPSKLKETFRADIARARTLLAQPVAEGPTDEELEKLAEPFSFVGEDGWTPVVYDEANYARAVLAKWGRPTPQPVVVSERLPSAADCDAEGNCWWFDPHADGAWYVDTFQSNYTHWLSTNALPTPEATND